MTFRKSAQHMDSQIDQGLKRYNIQSDDIQETSDFIEAALAGGGKVVVNCWGGGQEGVV